MRDTYARTTYTDSGYNAGIPFSYTVNRRECRFRKDADAFAAKTGICYTDDNGNGYTYGDIFRHVQDEDAAELIFNELDGSSPEAYLKESRLFSRCPRCGNWTRNRDGLFSRRDTVCPFCTPVRTNGKIRLEKDPYDDGRKFYRGRTACFLPGITTVAGCNGIGKSTLLQHIAGELKKKGVPHLMFDNLGGDGGEKSRTGLLEKALGGHADEDMACDDAISYAASLFTASEGERISAAIVRFARRIVKTVRQYDGYGEFWILFDAVDSGLSVDIIDIFKTYVLQDVMSQIPDTMQCYILLSSNSYEMSENTQMFFVHVNGYRNVSSYKRFKKMILKSAECKEDRDRILEERAEIRSVPYTFSWNSEMADRVDGYESCEEGILAELAKGGYTIRIRARRVNDTRRLKTELYKNESGCFELVRDKIRLESADFYLRKNDIEEELHGIVCERILRDRKSAEISAGKRS